LKRLQEMKTQFALGVVPTNHYAAKSAWQQLSILAHNLIVGFQLHTNLADRKPRSRKRTHSYPAVEHENGALHPHPSGRTPRSISRPQSPAPFPQPGHADSF
jgi:hypothetical protein